jgi:hypothetical protein
MHLAVLHDDVTASAEAIRALRRSGGDPTLKDSSGRTAADKALAERKDALLDVLEDPPERIAEEPLPNSSISIHVSAFPLANRGPEKTPYEVSVNILDHRPNAARSLFIDAVATANGVRLAPSGSGENNFYGRSGIRLGEGDRLEVILRHRLLGTIAVTAVVPPGVAAFRLTPALPEKGVPYNSTGATMTWVPNGADEYEAHVVSYDADGVQVAGWGYIARGASYTFKPEVFADGTGRFPYFQFGLRAADRTDIPGFGLGSALRVMSAAQSAQTNRP